MNLTFWRKEKKALKVPRVLNVPREKMEEFLTLYCAVSDARDARELKRFRLWAFVEDMFPETKTGRWKVVTGNATTAKIVELLEE